MKQIPDIIPDFLVVFMASTLVWRADMPSVFGFLIAVLLKMLSVVIPRLCPLDKPTYLEAEIETLWKRVKESEATILANAEYSAKEFGTMKNVLQIKQMGR